MSIWVSWVVIGLIFNYTYCFIFSRLSKTKQYLNIKTLLLCMFFAIVQGYTVYFKVTIRTIIILVDYIILLKLIFNKSITKTLIITFLVYILFAVSEIIFVIISLLILNLDKSYLTQTVTGVMITNSITVMITLIMFFCKKVRKTMDYIINWYEEKQVWSLLITIAVGSLTILFLLYRNLQGLNSVIEFFINNIFVIGIIYFVICFLMEKTANTKIKNEYNYLMNYAKTYEKEVIEKSKWQHEYENQLIMIRDKIDPENKKAIRYINKLLKDKPKNDNCQWVTKLSQFPDIGLKGLLHYKIGQMLQNHIQVYVDIIDENLIPTKLPEQLLEDNLQDISMVLGVYLDNAMQAASESDKKYLIVEFKCTDSQIIFQISNTYKGKIQIDKVGQERFTTKGKGHGYGLSLVKDILNKNPMLSQDREINGLYFVQKFSINYNQK